jgi:hypothetical protein
MKFFSLQLLVHPVKLLAYPASTQCVPGPFQQWQTGPGMKLTSQFPQELRVGVCKDLSPVFKTSSKPDTLENQFMVFGFKMFQTFA